MTEKHISEAGFFRTWMWTHDSYLICASQIIDALHYAWN